MPPPRAAVAVEQLVGERGPPAARRIVRERRPVTPPGADHRVDELPLLVDLVLPREEGRVAEHRVEDQPLGSLVVRAFGLVDLPRIEAESLGEMAVYAMVALPLLGMLAAAYARGAPEHRAAGLGFLALLIALTFFATVMDLVHLAFINSFYASQLILEVAEEGGELLCGSLALMLALIRVCSPLPGRPMIGSSMAA